MDKYLISNLRDRFVDNILLGKVYCNSKPAVIANLEISMAMSYYL
jgi:hypothetical protein